MQGKFCFRASIHGCRAHEWRYMVYGYERLVISHMSAEGASQDPSEWIVNGATGIGGEYGGPTDPAVLDAVS